MDSMDRDNEGVGRQHTAGKFAAQRSTAEDIVKSQTVGLVQLSDFRKRRAEAFEQTDRDPHNLVNSRFNTSTVSSGATTPGTLSDGATTSNEPQPKKKKKKAQQRSRLTFASDDEGGDGSDTGVKRAAKANASPLETTILTTPIESLKGNDASTQARRFGPNASIAIAPKVMTKSALRKAAEERDQIKKEFLAMQEAVKGTEIVIPFVFYDGTNIPGGACKIKKGEHVWLFLDRSRKVGAELGVGGNEKSGSKREWARISVDDLMLVRGDIIIPQHYEIYYFIVNKVKGSHGRQLFDFSATMDAAQVKTFTSRIDDEYDPLSHPGKAKSRNNGTWTPTDGDMEGSKDDPTFTKVVDRRWYERNKHLFPASTWQEYDVGKDYTNDVRKDAEGNAFFF